MTSSRMTITIDLQNDSDFTEVPDTSDFQRWVTAAMRSESVQLEKTIWWQGQRH